MKIESQLGVVPNYNQRMNEVYGPFSAALDFTKEERAARTAGKLMVAGVLTGTALALTACSENDPHSNDIIGALTEVGTFIKDRSEEFGRWAVRTQNNRVLASLIIGGVAGAITSIRGRGERQGKELLKGAWRDALEGGSGLAVTDIVAEGILFHTADPSLYHWWVTGPILFLFVGDRLTELYLQARGAE